MLDTGSEPWRSSRAADDRPRDNIADAVVGAEAAAISLESKIDGLMLMRALARSQGLVAAVEQIQRARRCVVTGMGKSGIVAQKIAATFRSTGQPAVFLDPAAAAHGDMGMIEPGDTVLMISNSGETDELRAVAAYAASYHNAIILVTSRPESSLGSAAGHVLRMPSVPEGGPIGQAPMSSIVCQLAIGDMLAAALMARRGFTTEQFLALHHGGYIGRQVNVAI